MAPASFRATAPGKLMLLGEHAVLHGRLSLVCAVDRYMTVELTPRQDSRVIITSDLGDYHSRLDRLDPDPRFRFILSAIEKVYSLRKGFDLTVCSDFSHQVGLGSSAAITAAALGAMAACQNNNLDENRLFRQGLSVIHAVQGSGSGADLAASIFGGVLTYRAEPLEIARLDPSFPICLFYSGRKKPTTEVIKIVNEKRMRHPELFDSIYDLMEQGVRSAKEAIKFSDWQRLGEILNINQGLMDAIGVNSPELADINFRLRKEKNIFGSKISGSGLGDGVVGIGAFKGEEMPYQQIPVQISKKGLVVEKI